MQEIFEFTMLVCFGLSWPISVWKSIKTKSTCGKSVLFMGAIIFGYVCGIAGKVVGEQYNYVLIIYCFNLAVVSLDLLLYFRNKRCESVKRRFENGKQLV